MGKKLTRPASKEFAAEAKRCFERMVQGLHAMHALVSANDIRTVSAFLARAEAKLPSDLSYNRERIERLSRSPKH